MQSMRARRGLHQPEAPRQGFRLIQVFSPSEGGCLLYFKVHFLVNCVLRVCMSDVRGRQRTVKGAEPELF